jgi:hypothetical protein
VYLGIPSARVLRVERRVAPSWLGPALRCLREATMPIYKWEIRFEADNDLDAREQADEAYNAFESVVSERLAQDADD